MITPASSATTPRFCEGVDEAVRSRLSRQLRAPPIVSAGGSRAAWRDFPKCFQSSPR